MLQKRIRKEELLPVTSLREYSSYLQQTSWEEALCTFIYCHCQSRKSQLVQIMLYACSVRLHELHNWRLCTSVITCLYCIFLWYSNQGCKKKQKKKQFGWYFPRLPIDKLYDQCGERLLFSPLMCKESINRIDWTVTLASHETSPE